MTTISYSEIIEESCNKEGHIINDFGNSAIRWSIIKAIYILPTGLLEGISQLELLKWIRWNG